MICSECGGNVISMNHAVYYPDGSSSGSYHCQRCGRCKSWFKKEISKEFVIDMKEEKS